MHDSEAQMNKKLENEDIKQQSVTVSEAKKS